MEERLCLTEKMLGVLASLKGKTLKSYEADLGGVDGDLAYQIVVLNTGSVRVPVIRMEEAHELFGEGEDAAPLECFAVEPGQEYHYFTEEDAKLYLVDERINAVEVVREHSTWEEDDGERRAMSEDVAIVVRTSGHALGLMVDFLDDIRVELSDDPQSNDVVPPVGRWWQWGYADEVHFERETIKL